MSMTEVMYWYSLHTDMWQEDQERNAALIRDATGVGNSG